MFCPKCGKDNQKENKFCRSCGHSLAEEIKEEDVKFLYYDRYKVIKPLRTGGMSTIYLAEDVTFDGLIYVIKEMSDVFTDDEEREYAIKKFKEEAYIQAKLRHPNIPVVNNHFLENNKYYIVMDYVEGINLEDLLQDSPVKGLSEKDVGDWAIQICEILEYLHSEDPPIIHRDIKPSNFIKREPDGRIMIIDFGIAKIFETQETVTLTGTPGYIAPELYRGQTDTRADIYALGATMHQLLTGRDPSLAAPFAFPTITSIRPDVSKIMEKIIEKCLEKELEDRYSSATALKNDLIALKQPAPAVPSIGINQAMKKPLLITETTPQKIFKGQDKKEALKLMRDGSPPSSPSSPPPLPPPLPPPISQPVMEEPPVKKEDIQSSISYLRSVQLQSFQGKQAIVKILKSFVGIDIGTERIKILQFAIDDGYFIHPSGMAVAEIPPNTVRDGIIINPKTVGAFIKQIIDKQGIKARRAIVSIPRICAKNTSFVVPERATYKMDDIILEEAKKHFSFSLKKAKVCYETLDFFDPDQMGKLNVLVWAAEEKVIEAIKQAMAYAGLYLWDTEFESFAIKNSLELILSDQNKQNSVAVVSLGASSSAVHIIRNSQIWFNRSFFPGGSEFTSAIADRINVDRKQAESLKITKANMDISRASHIDYVLFKTIDPLVTRIKEEIEDIIKSYREKYKIPMPPSVLLCGGTSLLKNIDHFIEKDNSFKAALFKLPASRKIEANRELIEELGTSFMVTMGLTIKPYLKRVDLAELDEEPSVVIRAEEKKKEPERKKGFWGWLTGR